MRYRLCGLGKPQLKCGIVVDVIKNTGFSHFDIEVLSRHVKLYRFCITVFQEDRSVAEDRAVVGNNFGHVRAPISVALRIISHGIWQPSVVGSHLHFVGGNPFKFGILALLKLHFQPLQVAHMDSETIVCIPSPEMVLLVVGVILNLDSGHVVKTSLIGGVAERQPGAVHIAIANHTISVVSLSEIATFGPLTNLVERTRACHHIERLIRTISFKAIGLTVVIAVPDRDGWILCRQYSASISIKATEIVHTRVFVDSGAPLIAFAVAHLGDIDVTPVGATARVGELTRNGMCRKR